MSKKKQKKSGDTIAEKTTVPIKEEHGGDSTREHLHQFTVKFPPDNKEYTMTCDQPGTVLRALQSSDRYKELMFEDEKLVIQLGKADGEIIIATHFPCCCISEDESLLITCETKPVEEAQHQPNTMVDSSDECSVFYIDTVGGLNTKTKPLFLNSALKKFKYLCVYGEKGMTVQDALQRDGRFIDLLDNFKLSDNKNPERLTECSQIVDKLNGKTFKICLLKRKRDKTKGASDSHRRDKSDARVRASKSNGDTTAVLAVLKQRATSVAEVLANRDNSVNVDEVYEKLRNQFPDLKKLMDSRFPGDSYQRALELRKEDFVKIQKSFSEVHRVRQLVKLGESVCKVVVKGFGEGTGFVLFDNFILTNAHLFKDCVEEGRLKSETKVYALFNYEEPEPHIKYICYPVNVTLCRYDPDELDYAILEIDPEGQDPMPTQQIKVPPGLLKVFGPMPSDGEACIVGHPAGSVKQMDPTIIIEKEQRQQAVDDQLSPYKDTLFTLMSITHVLGEKGINKVMMGGKLVDKVVTYNTFMYHGASGSPVFDARCRVFGLHTAGFVFFEFPTQSVLELAQPLLTIFKDFVRWLKEHREDDMLQRVKEAAEENSYLQEVLNAIDTESPTFRDEPME
ncbi:serine protease FAM111A-like [Pseudoliparis swirei]|uniref:serine protease FAM111A-like n=1 Tax=Pseudoliparis swirei TaxID=2059687 RepID=UPI0024BE9F6B|nr:serine protease FAM111A-like [Pseudoliparis swirei]XP_056299349.1 serine protease FAM111A-like [Pseudoliparis swirei]XP_056299351.1 serine protease FAM111A-like [Pseudoliparis swirei]XP_056299352.1 serine protease FAM111A-like [Pseudoliparis swirei]